MRQCQKNVTFPPAFSTSVENTSQQISKSARPNKLTYTPISLSPNKPNLIQTDVHLVNNAVVSFVSLQNELNSVLDVNTGDLLEHRHLTKGTDKEIWNKSLANDINRLAQCVVTRMTGTNTIFFIHPRDCFFLP